MHRNTKVALDAYTELRRRLEGECGDVCPMNCNKTKYSNPHISKYRREKRKKYISRTEDEFCGYCEKFHFIKNKKDHNCPCYRLSNPEEIFLYLDEFIEELQEQLSKEYSS